MRPVHILLAAVLTAAVPIGLMGMASRFASLLGDRSLETGLTGNHLKYGFSLDTNRAKRHLGFEPNYRIGFARAGDGKLRLETAPGAIVSCERTGVWLVGDLPAPGRLIARSLKLS